MNMDEARFAIVLTRALRIAGDVGALTLVIALILLVYRRFRPSTGTVPHGRQAAAAMALILGVYAVIGGMGHSGAVASLALNEPGYGPVQILRFTTGAMLLYAGAMNIALYRSIGAGRRWAIGVALATNLLFWSHLFLALTLPGTGGTVPPPLGVWTVYLCWLGAAAFASRGAQGVGGIDRGQTWA